MPAPMRDRMAEDGPGGDIARLNAVFDSPAFATLGGRLVALDARAGISEVAFYPKPEFCNPMGQVQGGFVTAMLDAAAGIAAIARSGFTHFVPTLDIRTSFIRPTKAEEVIAHGRCLRLGRNIGFLEADLCDMDGLLLARASITCRPIAFDKVRPSPDTA